MSARYSILNTSLRTAGIMLVFTVVFTALMASTHQATWPAIAQSIKQEQMRLIDEVLPPTHYDNVLLDDFVQLAPGSAAAAALALSDGGSIWRARKGGAPAALVLEAAATDGYAGRIALVVAVDSDGRVAGVRVTAHKETPGLGDYIDPKKDRDKSRPWITRFAGLSWSTLDAARWTVKKDGGEFDYHTGATISARAVSRAVGRVARFAVAHRDELFAAPAGSMLQGIQP